MNLCFGASTMSSDRETEKLEKLMAQEATLDKKNLARATKEFQKAEKAHMKSVKVKEKAEKKLTKTTKERSKAEQVLHKAEHKHEDAVSSRKRAETNLTDAQEQESLDLSDVQQRQSYLSDVQETKKENDRDRKSRLVEASSKIVQSRAARSSGRTANGGATTSLPDGVEAPREHDP